METPVKTDIAVLRDSNGNQLRGRSINGSSDNEDALEEFGSLKIEERQSSNDSNQDGQDTVGVLKRPMEFMSTVEGSPLVVSLKKRQDLQNTPVKFIPIMDTHRELVDDASSCAAVSVPVVPNVAAGGSSSHKILTISTESGSHDTRKDHQESVERTRVLCGTHGCLRRPEVAPHLLWLQESSSLSSSSSSVPAAVPITDLLRVHEYSYLKHLQDQCDAAADNDDGKCVKRNHPPFYAPAGYLDSDTPIGKLSLNTAKLFCSAAIHAVDVVMRGFDMPLPAPAAVATAAASSANTTIENNNIIDRAFVIGRPPGHHAGPNGCVVSPHHWKRPDMSSSGFCLLNTAAVAAAYARYRYGHNAPEGRAPRIAIVDIDVHHGNGTEEIVRNLVPHTTYLPLPSSWAPMSMTSYKPWLNEKDAEEVFFASIHLFSEEQFYPCSGNEALNDPRSNIVNVCLTPIGPGPWDQKGRAKLTHSQRQELIQQANTELKTKVSSMLLPRLRQFGADLLILSSGFDAHHQDLYHFLNESSIHWLTQQLCDTVRVGEGRKGGRVISILEGGYSLQSVVPAPETAAAKQLREKKEKAASAAATASAGAATSAATSSDDATAGATRANRGKNKKYEQFVTTSATSAPSSSSSSGTSDSIASPKAVAPVVAPCPDTMFAQLPADGGLVRGVLSHIAALAGVDNFVALDK